MRRQRLLVLVERDGQINTGPTGFEQVKATITDDNELQVEITLEADELGRVPVEAIRFNRYETQKIRTVLGHTK